MNRKLRQIGKQLSADKRKLSVVVVLLAVMGLLWGRMLWNKAPATALASGPQGQADNAAVDNSPRTRLLAGPVVYVDLPDQMERDLYALDDSLYARSKPMVNVLVQEKSVTQPADVVPEAELIRRAAQKLVLQTTIMGEQPKAVINGQLIAPGQQIGGFELLTIHPRRVVIQMNGVQIVLEM
ncbi:MAG: hypothetical protein WD042_18000 [Phycisphaeraceae bacterium]